MPNLFQALPAHALPEEVVEVLAAGGTTRVERIVSTGQASPPGFWYDQELAEWVVLLAGWAELRLADEAGARRLEPGDHVLIPPHARHRVEATAPDQATVWLAVFFAPAE